MRRIVLGALIFVVVAGCGRKGPPPAAELGGQGQSQLVPVEASGPSGEAPGGQVYEGRSAPQWGQILETQGQNAATRTRASVALGKLGEAGYTYLAAGLKSSSDDVRLASLQAMGKPELVAHSRETMPELLGMLNSRNPGLRQAAAARLAWYGMDSQQALDSLRRVATRDEDPEVRRVAEAAIVEIDEYVKSGGKITRGKRPDRPPAK